MVAIAIWGGDMALDKLDTDKLVAAILAYAALALGFFKDEAESSSRSGDGIEPSKRRAAPPCRF